MKRFFIIFAICFASIIGVFAGVFGIKYLKGDFNEKVINPESIAFELEEYDVTGDFQITITTPTEDVTATKVELSFSKGTTFYTYNSKNFITDGVIIIPKQVNLNVPFEVKLFTTSDEELGGINWIKGGISNLVAKSENITTKEATTKVCVDVPVYKSEIVLFNSEGEIETNDITKVLGSIEKQNGLIKQGEDISFNAGDTFYLGLKYLPQRSAYKYSKVNSTNLFIEYKEQIISKISELNLNYSDKINALYNLFSDEALSKQVNFQEIIDAYQQIINLNNETDSSALGQFTRYLVNINNEFENNLKYYIYEESPNNGRTFTTKLNRIAGTNLYKVQATTDSTSFTNKVNVNLYSYTFCNSGIEADTRAIYTDESMLLNKLEELSKNNDSKVVDKNEKNFSIVDVDVDTIKINGEVSDFNTNKIHNLYASKSGENNSDTSYLDINLSNSNISTVNLQDKILKTGIRFEKRLGTNEWGNADEIKFVNPDNYTQVIYDGKLYYLPIGTKNNYTNAYWQIYSNEYISNDIRLVLAYFKTYELNDNQNLEALNAVVAQSNKVFRLNNAVSNENMVSWISLDNLKLGVVNMSGVIDMSAQNVNDNEIETTRDVKYNKEIDLTKLINIPSTNNFQVYKFFLFSNDEDATNKISNYFNTKDYDSKEYTFNGITQKLYELDGNILKLKNENIPNYSISVIFATIETDALRNPIMNDGKYSIIKYSAVKDSLVENLSSLSIEFSNSINTLKGSVTISNANSAGISNETDPQFKIAQNTNNVLKVTIADKNGDVSDNLKNAILNGNLIVEARTKKNEATNYIAYKSFVEANSYGFDITTLPIDKDVTIRLYFVYTIDGNDYLFPIQIDTNNTTFYVGTIIKETNSKAYFNFEDENGQYINIEDIEKINVTTKYENNSFSKSYIATLKDGAIIENVQLFKENVLNVRIINFLGNEINTGDWYLTSSNNNIISIQDNQLLNFVGNSDKPITINLYLGTTNNGVLCEQVNFVVSTPGYVESVVVDGREVYEYDQETQITYNFPKQNILKTINKDSALSLKSLLNIGYKISSVDTSIDLSLNIYIANETTLNALKTITSNNTLNLSEDISNIDLKLLKDLGDIVSLDLIYKCEELGIVQTINLKLNQTIKVKNLKLTDKSGAEVKINSTIYDIFAGVPYEISVDNDENLYWFKEGETQTNAITDKKFSIIYNDSVSGEQKIYITNVNSTEINVGDLNYIIILNVQKNIDIKKDSNATISLISNKTTINLSELLERKTNNKINMSLIENSLQGNLSLQFKDTTGYSYAEDNKYVDETQSTINQNELQLAFKSFSNNANIKFWIVCDDVNLVYVSLSIMPEDLRSTSDKHFANYKNQKAIIVYNTEKISSDNDKTNIFVSMFVNGAEVVCDNDFYTTYTTKDNTIRQVSQTSTTELFTNTNTYVTVTKDGISSTYLIVISKLSFPFVAFKDNSGQELSYKNLDVFKLFVDTDNLCEYYSANNIAFFTTEEDKKLNLVGENGIYIVGDNSNVANFTDKGFIEMANEDNGNATDYASLTSTGSTIILESNEIGVEGGVYLKIFIKLALANTSSFVSIPVIVNLPQSQCLQVEYPNSGEIVTANNNYNYGSESYDQILLQTDVPFSNGLNEYVSFETNGRASLVLFGDKYSRFNILKLDGNNWSIDPNQNLDSLTYSIEKITINLANTWSFVDKSNFTDYANILVSDGLVKLTLYKNNGVSIVRVKIKISTSSGAVSYYYVSAGEVTPLTIMRKSDNSSTSLTIGITDNININSLEKILIGTSEQSLTYKYYYYLTNSSYSNQLKFRIVNNNKIIELNDNNENEFVKLENGYLSTKVQPMGAEFQIELYTLYGVISTINVVVDSAYTISLKPEIVNKLYSGTEYSLTELFNITTDVEGLNTNFVLSESKSFDYYSYNADKVSFNHISESKIFNLYIEILIDNQYNYIFNQEITLLPRITSKYTDPNPAKAFSDPDLTTYTVQGTSITLKQKLISDLFEDKLLGINSNINIENIKGVEYWITYNSTSEKIDINNISLEIGAITSQIFKLLTVEIKNEDITIATAYAYLTIYSQYTVVINYPSVIDGSLDAEYVQTGATIEFNKPNFNNNMRVVVTDSLLGVEKEFSIKTDSQNQGDDVYGEQITINADTTFYIYIDGIYYAEYKVVASELSPFVFTANENLTIFVNNGDKNVFGYVDVEVTIPNINNAPETVSLYVKDENDNIKVIKENIYYNNNEKVRAVLEIADYKEGLSKVYLQIGNSQSAEDIECVAEFTTRCELKYCGRDVKFANYNQIIGTLDLSNSLTEKSYVNEMQTNGQVELEGIKLKSACSIIKNNNVAEGISINYAYDIKLKSENKIELNANEYQDGLSFVELFNLQDKLNNIFGYNQSQSANISLKIDSSSQGIINCLLITPQLKNKKAIDYYLKAVGASNNGTKVNLIFEYSVEERAELPSYIVNLEITIKTDVEYEVYNNDGTATPNSKTNPLRLTSPSQAESATFILASLEQKNYIYAYGKYSNVEPKPNLIASWSEPDVSGDTNYFSLSKENGVLSLSYRKATFGNKTLTIIFTDPYGFTFSYYIELIATTSISSYSLDSGKFFEGGELFVYNRNNKEESDRKGVGLFLISDGLKDTSTSFKIVSISFRDSNDKSYSIGSDYCPISSVENNKILFKFMNMGNELGLNGKLEIWITKSVNSGISNVTDETFFIEVDFVLYKRYSVEIATENTYVRENVPVNLAHFIDVYDYKQESYLGIPELNKYELVSASIETNKINIGNDTLEGIINKQIAAYNDPAADDVSREKVWAELRKYGITQHTDIVGELAISNLGIMVNVKAIHKTSLTSTITQSYVSLGSSIKIRIILGTESSAFGASVTSQNYNFELYLYNMVDSSSGVKLATTIDNDIGENDECPKKAQTGYTYHLSIINSDNLSQDVKLGLMVNNVFDTVSIGKFFDDYLEQFDNQIVELATGIFNGDIYINGLTISDVLNAKNIKNETNFYEKLETTPSLKSTIFGESEIYKIKYQEQDLTGIDLYFAEYDDSEDRTKNATTILSGVLRVTTKYTGIDTTFAYSSGSIHYCYDLDYKVNEDGTIAGDNKTVALDKWSDGFTLIPGIGISAIMAQKEDVTFFGKNQDILNVDSLIFEPANVITNSGDKIDADTLFAIDTKGNITLKSAFKPNDYYIGINVYCKYGNNNKSLLNTIYVAFIDVDNYDVYKVDSNKYDLYINYQDIDYKNINYEQLTINDIQLGLFNAISYDSNNKKVSFIINNTDVVVGKMFMLKLGSLTKYVRINTLHILEASSSISITKNGDSYEFNYQENLFKYDDNATFIRNIVLRDLDNNKTFEFTYNEDKDNNDVIIRKYYTCNSVNDLSSGYYWFYYNKCACEVNLDVQ